MWVDPVAVILALLGVLRLAWPFFGGLRAKRTEPELVLELDFWGRARQGFWGLVAGLVAGLLMLGLQKEPEAGMIVMASVLFLVLLPQRYILTQEGLALNGCSIGYWEDYSGFFADPKYVVLFADHTARILWGQSEANTELLSALAKRLPRTRNIARSKIEDESTTSPEDPERN